MSTKVTKKKPPPPLSKIKTSLPDTRAFSSSSSSSSQASPVSPPLPVDVEFEKLRKRHQGRDNLSLQKKDQLVTDLREFGLPRTANKLLMDMLTEHAPADARMGWTSDFPRQKGAAKKSTNHPFKIPVARPNLQYVPKNKPDLSQILVPKFRGIHYRTEPSSRFANQDEYERHVGLNEEGHPTYSPAVYGLKKRTDKHGRLRAAHTKESLEQNEKLKEFFSSISSSSSSSSASAQSQPQPQESSEASSEASSEEDYVYPPLASDVALLDAARLKKQKIVKLSGAKVAENQKTQYEHEAQVYVNQYAKYDKERVKTSKLPGIRQNSTSDSPYHAGLYSYGGKFTTERQAELAKAAKESAAKSEGKGKATSAKEDKEEAVKKRKRESPTPSISSSSSSSSSSSDESSEEGDTLPSKKRKVSKSPTGMFGGRRVEGTVGKANVYLFPPSDLLAQQPAVIPQMQAQKRVAIHPHQQWELESTFDSEIPGQYLKAQKLANIPKPKPKAKAEAYSAISDKPKGQTQRQKFSRDLGAELWKEAQAKTVEQRKLLIPHGTLAAISEHYGGLEKLEKERADKGEATRKRALEKYVAARSEAEKAKKAKMAKMESSQNM